MLKHLKSILTLSLLLFLIISCKPKGDKAIVNEAAKVKTAAGKSYSVNLSNSKVLWEGAKPAGKHNGYINLKSGSITTKDDQIQSGIFVMDMNTITVSDLEPGAGKEDLEGHLKGLGGDNSDDFFNVTKFPTAKFEITKVTKLMNDPEANTMIFGNLTLKGKTQEVGFKASTTIEGNKVSVNAPQFTIDRTQWGLNFMSKTAFDNLKDKFINDEIGIQIQLNGNVGTIM